MAENCKAKYKNLNRIQSFSEQRYATVQLMQQACMNDEWLRQQVETLTYLSPPAVRKTFTPANVDEDQSWGYEINSDNTVSFSTAKTDERFIDFSDETLKYLDDTVITNNAEIHITETERYACLPRNKVNTINTSVGDWDGTSGMNEAWYVGYDKSKTYQVVSEWTHNVWHKKIPSVCRAQTFKVTGLSSSSATALLRAVVIKLKFGGSETSNVQSPLYVQIRKTVEQEAEIYDMKGEFENKEFKFTHKNPVEYEKILFPDGNPDDALATAVFYPDETTPYNVTIEFDNPPVVKNGETYAIVFASPISHYDHAPRIGGWGRKCNPDKYENGYAFTSDNNGYDWRRYGDDDYTVDYSFGKRWPRDFAFQVHLQEIQTGYPKDTEYYLYLKPFYSNPITSVVLSSDYDKANQTMTFEVSTTGHPDSWVDITSTRKAVFTPDENGEYSHVLFTRIGFKTSSEAITPKLKTLRVILTTLSPDEMYVRTKIYNPRTEPMLGANMWGRVFAPFETDPATTCSVELIPDKLSRETFALVNPVNLVNYSWVDGLDMDKIKNKTESQIKSYLTDNPDVVSLLEDNNVYVLGFIESFKLNNSPAYPLKQVSLQPATTTIQPYAFGEWYDFIFDYTEDTLTFHEYMLENQLIEGDLIVDYNPLFVDGLSNVEVGTRVNDETGLVEEGLILDYFKEIFVVTEENIETRQLNLRVSPVDPIRSVVLNKDTDDEATLQENVDYTLDADNKLLIFNIVGSDGESSRLQLGDTVEVVYTPDLQESGISIGYHATRTDLKKDVRIKPNYIEYKV